MDKRDMEISGVIVLLVVVIVILVVAVVMLMRYQEHTAALYERRMAANAHLVSMVRDQSGMRVTIYRDGSMAMDTSANESQGKAEPQAQPARPAVPSDADALGEAARLVRASLRHADYAPKNQIIPANKWTSAEMWQRAIDAMRSRGLLLDVSANGRTGTFPASGTTLVDVLERVNEIRHGVLLDDAVAALPLAARAE